MMPSADERSRRRSVGSSCEVLIIDTGAFPQITAASAAGGNPAQAARDLLTPALTDYEDDPWDADANKVLDPYAGHGTFISGIIANLAPGTAITVERGLSSYGDTDDARIARALLDRFDVEGDQPPFDIVSMSFGGFCEDDDPPIAIARAISSIQARYREVGDSRSIIRERVVFVASAGNSSSCRPTWPASFENVIAVGALGPSGPAWFTNYGPWVDACAPGVDVVSCFYDLGGDARHDGEDFDGWASWSGTSFSAPIVAASIAWEWMCRGGRQDFPASQTPGDAAAWLLDRPGHFRYPWLGTVVNPH